MLIKLSLKNIVLVVEAEVPFKKGLNIISGETGSGKSAVMEALKLVMGQRLDSNLLRHEEESGSIEALFDIDKNPTIFNILEECGITHEVGEELIISRQLSRQGKSRSFVNNQPVQLPILRQLAPELFDLVGQHSHQSLKSNDYYRTTLDQFGNLHEEATAVKNLWEKRQQLEKELDKLLSNESQRLREIEICHMEINEISDANLQEEEEELLFSEYSRLTHVEELHGLVQGIQASLSDNHKSILPQLQQLQNSAQQAERIDPALEDTLRPLNDAFLELQEVSYTLQSYSSSIQNDPHRLTIVNERMSLIHQLKRKYGNSLSEILSYAEKRREQLLLLENTDNEIEEIKAELAATEQTYQKETLLLTEKRRESAKLLEKGVTHVIQDLNMAHAEFYIDLVPQKPNHHGAEKIEFLLSPNQGEKKSPLRECASGGELSRIMLALKSVMVNLDKTAVLIFDEIDANLGGETAVIIGKYLHAIGQKHQLLCITHLPQVALQGDHHIMIKKESSNARTVTTISVAEDQALKSEMIRMLGGDAIAGVTTKSFAEKLLETKKTLIKQ